MFLYQYWNNNKQWHGELLYQCFALTIAEADAKFVTQIGYSPDKYNWIGCQVHKWSLN